MPWSTPIVAGSASLWSATTSAAVCRVLTRRFRIAVLRVLSDNQGGLCHLTLQYIDWLTLQLIPDTAETEWLDRHGDIWLTNADGTTGRKMATLAEGAVEVTGNGGTAIPVGHRFLYSGGQTYEALELVILLADAATPVPVRALDPGAAGNLPPGTIVSMVPLAGIDTGATVVNLDGGTDEENDDDLRVRVLATHSPAADGRCRP